MPYKPSQARYDGGGKVLWLVYDSPQPLPGGRRAVRTHVKRLYFPAEARSIKVSTPHKLSNRTGRKLFGAEVRYEYNVAAAQARRNRKRFEIPERWSSRTKVVALPREAKGVQLTDTPPEGARIDVA